MQNRFALLSLSGLKIGTKLTLLAFVLVSAILAALLAFISSSTSRILEQGAMRDMAAQVKSATDMIDTFNQSSQKEVARLATLLEGDFPGKFSLDASQTVEIAGIKTPLLKTGDSVVNLDTKIIDAFSTKANVTATMFARMGEDYVRVSTSVKKENGERALGTKLDRSSPAYAAIQEGRPFYGLVTLFGKPFITAYVPLKNERSQNIGIVFVGVDLTHEMTALTDRIKSIRIGDTGYLFVVNGKAGADFGKLIVHPTRQNASAFADTDAAVKSHFEKILKNGEGSLNYVANQKGEPVQSAGAGREQRIAAYATYKNWNWVIGGDASRSEITKNFDRLWLMNAMVGLVALVLFAVFFWIAVRIFVSRPLQKAQVAAERLATGDLTSQVTVVSQDEIGSLGTAINSIGRELALVVRSIRSGTDEVSAAAGQVSSGNLELSSRTEQQAASLEETASSLEELTSTVAQNADNAQQANQMALSASGVAEKGGLVVEQVVHTMGEITHSARKIADIISVIDGIAFQTNLLALNAAVEAARAGEQGRGFAVVATEVRSLAARSASAAKEIKTLIDTSVRNVEAGNELVAKAGGTMNEIVLNVKRVTDIMAEILAASTEQRDGITQINRTVSEMDAGTQQNAAMVEEVSGASESLLNLAKQLSDNVAVFIVSDEDRATPAAKGHSRRHGA